MTSNVNVSSRISLSRFPLNGLVLTGGQSRRMGVDKATINYRGKPHGEYSFDLLIRHCDRVFYSVAADQPVENTPMPVIYDRLKDSGPIAGIHAALLEDSTSGWLVLACDLPMIHDDVIEALIAERDPEYLATAYVSEHDGLPEPLCAIYEPAMLAQLTEFMRGGTVCPRKLLMNSKVKLIKLPRGNALINANDPCESDVARRALGENPDAAISIQLRYFASLKDAVGRSTEELSSMAKTPQDLYRDLRERYGFSLDASLVRYAVNGAFVPGSTNLKSGDEVVFIPPVAGG